MELTWWGTWALGALPLGLCLLSWWWNELLYVLPVKARLIATGGGRHLRLPPGRMGLPLLGELFSFLWYFKFLRRPDDFINAKRIRYGDDGSGLYRTHLFGRPSVIACSPSAVKFVFQHDKEFPYSWPTNDLIGPSSIVSAPLPEHARLRRFLLKAVNQPKALQRTALSIQPRIIASLQSWAERGEVTAYDQVKKMSFENIGQLFVSFEPGPLLDEIFRLFDGLNKGFRAHPINFPGTAYRHALKCRRKLTEIFRTELHKRKRDAQTRDDLMDGLMNLRDDDGNMMSDVEVVDNIVSLVIAGFESTVVAITWAIYYLGLFPAVLEKVREENIAIRQSREGDFITSEDVSNMKYTKKVIEETLRLANITWISFRSGGEDIEYQGYVIPRGWKVISWLRYLHTDPRNFDDPMCFNPERWNEPIKPGAYQVFGGGSRSCAGDMLARMQISVFLHHLSVGYRWRLLNPDSPITYLPRRTPTDGVKIAFNAI